MEPAQAKVRYIIHTFVQDVRQVGSDWYVHFAGSRESLSFGPGDQPFKIAEPVKITFERTQDAQPVSTPEQ